MKSFENGFYSDIETSKGTIMLPALCPRQDTKSLTNQYNLTDTKYPSFRVIWHISKHQGYHNPLFGHIRVSNTSESEGHTKKI